MSKGTISREEMREQLQHDEVGDAIKKSMQFIQKHRITLILVLVIVIAVLVGWRLIQFRTEKARENANVEYLQASQNYIRAMFSSNVDVAGRQNLLDQTIQSAEQLREAYPNTQASRMALYLKATAFLAKYDDPGTSENADKAIATFQQYLDTASSKEDKARGYLGLAVAYQNRAWLTETAQDQDRAETAYNDVIKMLPADSYLTLEAKLSLGQMYAASGNATKATDLFRQIVSAVGEPESGSSEPVAVTALERQQQLLREQVDTILNRFSYSRIAEAELQKIIPSSAKALQVEIPEAGEAQ